MRKRLADGLPQAILKLSDFYKFIFQLDQFLVADLHPVLKFDAKLSSHPIVQTVTTPDEITAIFDTISYNKVNSHTSEMELHLPKLLFFRVHQFCAC